MQRCRYIFLVMILCPLVFAEDVSDESEKRNIIAYHYWNIVHNVSDYAFLDFPVEYQHFWGHSGVYGSIELGRTLPWHDGEDATLIGAALGVMYKFRPVGVSGPYMRTSLGLTALLPDQKNDDDPRFLVYEFVAGYTFRPADIRI